MKLIRKPHESDGVYEITPSEAALMLEQMKKQRPLSDSDAEAIARDIRENKWVTNGETVILNGDGSVLDGQHRLRACVLADKAIQTYVVFGFGSSVSEFDSLDQGRTRSSGDRLALDGVENYSVQAAVARLAVRYDGMVTKGTKTLINGTRIRPAVIRAARAKLSPQIDKSCSLAKSYQKNLRGLLSPAILAFVHMKAAAIDSDKADTFAHALATGERLATSNPVLALRNNLVARAAAQSKTPGEIGLALCIRAWNAFAAGRSLKIVKWDTERESFPTFEPR